MHAPIHRRGRETRACRAGSMRIGSVRGRHRRNGNEFAKICRRDDGVPCPDCRLRLRPRERDPEPLRGPASREARLNRRSRPGSSSSRKANTRTRPRACKAPSNWGWPAIRTESRRTNTLPSSTAYRGASAHAGRSSARRSKSTHRWNLNHRKQGIRSGARNSAAPRREDNKRRQASRRAADRLLSRTLSHCRT